jgi:hypothetical protein
MDHGSLEATIQARCVEQDKNSSILRSERTLTSCYLVGSRVIENTQSNFNLHSSPIICQPFFFLRILTPTSHHQVDSPYLAPTPAVHLSKILSFIHPSIHHPSTPGYHLHIARVDKAGRQTENAQSIFASGVEPPSQEIVRKGTIS